MNNRPVSFYMNANPIFLPESSKMREVIQGMNENNISHMLLKNTDNKLSGIISKSDLLKKSLKLLFNSSGRVFSMKDMEATMASDIMTSDFISVKPEDSVEYAIELLLQKAFHCLPVLENESLVGVITFSDLLKTYYQEHG